jgi:hypothetical protein
VINEEQRQAGIKALCSAKARLITIPQLFSKYRLMRWLQGDDDRQVEEFFRTLHFDINEAMDILAEKKLNLSTAVMAVGRTTVEQIETYIKEK